MDLRLRTQGLNWLARLVRLLRSGLQDSEFEAKL